MVSKFPQSVANNLSVALVAIGLASHFSGRERTNHVPELINTEFSTHIDAKNGGYSLLEAKNGELFRQSGEIRVRIARTEVDFTAPDTVIIDSTYRAAEAWNVLLEDIDPSVYFTVEEGLISIDCDGLYPNDIESGVVVVCVSSHDYKFNEDGVLGHTLNQFASDGENRIQGSVVKIFPEEIRKIRDFAPVNDAIPEFVVPRLVTHEFGHVLGLGDGKVGENSVMSDDSTFIINGENTSAEFYSGQINDAIREGLSEIYTN